MALNMMSLMMLILNNVFLVMAIIVMTLLAVVAICLWLMKQPGTTKIMFNMVGLFKLEVEKQAVHIPEDKHGDQ